MFEGYLTPLVVGDCTAPAGFPWTAFDGRLLASLPLTPLPPPPDVAGFFLPSLAVDALGEAAGVLPLPPEPEVLVAALLVAVDDAVVVDEDDITLGFWSVVSLPLETPVGRWAMTTSLMGFYQSLTLNIFYSLFFDNFFRCSRDGFAVG